MNGAHGSLLEHIRAQVVRMRRQSARPAPAGESRRVGLALGGGGGKGASHLGVIEVLEQLQVPIDLIVGTSAGGAVAVLYAAGVSLDEIRESFRDNTLRRIAVPDHTRTGIFGQKRREEGLVRLLGDRTFADLRIPCAVTATDLVSGQVVLIDEGPLVEAVLATTALPSIFPPIIRGEMALADGGILNNLPVDVARRMGADKVIAVELNDAVPGFTLTSVEAPNPLARLMLAPQQFAIANRALSLLINHATALHLQANPPDLLLSPYVADIPTLDMGAPEKGQHAGIVATREAAAQLLELRAWRLREATPAPVPEWPALPDAPELAEELANTAPAGSNLELAEAEWPAATQNDQENSWLRLPFDLPRWWDDSAPDNRDR